MIDRDAREDARKFADAAELDRTETKCKDTNTQAIQACIEHWRRNRQFALDGQSVDRGADACALCCLHNTRCSECPITLTGFLSCPTEGSQFRATADNTPEASAAMVEMLLVVKERWNNRPTEPVKRMARFFTSRENLPAEDPAYVDYIVAVSQYSRSGEVSINLLDREGHKVQTGHICILGTNPAQIRMESLLDVEGVKSVTSDRIFPIEGLTSDHSEKLPDEDNDE